MTPGTMSANESPATSRDDHAKPCASCLCMACRHVVDCPIHRAAGSREVSGNTVHMTRCVTVCSGGVTTGDGVGKTPVVAKPLALVSPLTLTETGSWMRHEDELDEAAALAICHGWAPEIPISETPKRGWSMMAGAMQKGRKR